MRNKTIKALCVTAATVVACTSLNLTAYASGGVTSVLPSAGINFTLGQNTTSLSQLQEDSEKAKENTTTVGANTSDSQDGTVKVDVKESTENGTDDKTGLTASLNDLTASVNGGVVNKTNNDEHTTQTGKVIEETIIVSKGYTADLAAAAGTSLEESEEEGFKKLVIAQVTNYVNVRDTASEEGEIVGKLYNNSVGTFIEEQDGWYKISSGSVEGYVKGEFCVTGDAAVELAKKVGTRIATVNTTTLKVREEPGLDATVLGLIPIEDELEVMEEQEGWVKVNIEEGDGWVSTDYVDLSTEFVKAESKAEEEARLAKEEAERQAALKAAAAAAQKNNANKGNKSGGSKYKDTGVYAASGSGTGASVANYALQFVGNPYVYGGSSLTNGTDCSGFVMSVYKNFGVSLPHSSGADRSVGASVGSLSDAQAGDIVCYSGHVGIYIGNGQIVHASNSRTGIIVSNASYRNILSIRRIF